MRTRAWIASLAGAMLVCVVVVAAVAAAAQPRTRAPSAHASRASCSDPYHARRDQANPLMLSSAPGSDPLRGANFFVDGPAHGMAAQAIAQLIGASGFSDHFSWQRLSIMADRYAASHPAVARNIALLSKIAAEPEPQRFSSFSAGGGPGAVYGQVQKVLCFNLGADPGTIPIITTYFLHATLKGCPSAGEIYGYMPTFKRRVDEVAAGIGNRPAVLLLELDAIGSSSCIFKHGAGGAYESALRYEVDRMATLPHGVVYVEGGYSDGNSPAYTAKVLNHIDVRKIRGFFTNDTHLNWTSREIAWGNQVSRLTHGAHFVVNTAENGQGPKKNAHRSTQGIEDLCNPPGRGLGPKPNTNTGFPNVDAFLWSHVPGASSGCGGGPPAGIFWAAKAEGEAARANGELGPGYPSQPY